MPPPFKGQMESQKINRIKNVQYIPTLGVTLKMTSNHVRSASWRQADMYHAVLHQSFRQVRLQE
jgi:hypothetical protein